MYGKGYFLQYPHKHGLGSEILRLILSLLCFAERQTHTLQACTHAHTTLISLQNDFTP